MTRLTALELAWCNARRVTQEADHASGKELIATFRRTNRRLRVELGYAAETGGTVSYARYEIFAAVAADPSQHASSLAHHLGLSRQAISL
ncbi:MAG: hypothetical protein ACJ79E_21100, partial [Anaeromyxobacteraceae bacterium]